MSFQLIFTSTPRGLTLGRSGFCTVARHRELSDSLVTALERCSAYERSENPRSELPVIQAYRILRVGSSTYHVLTRIQDAGVDYTQRGNHIAQHLIFLPVELTETPTPADIFLNWNGWLEAWNEAPRYLDAGEQPLLASIPKSTSLPAQTWQHLTGDAVHAALLAQPNFRQGVILTSQNLSPHQALHLIGESLLLIETEESGLPGPWNIPFTTHLQTHDQEDDFLWRCQESPEAGLISSRQGIPVLSLESSHWPPVTVPSLAKRAREGGASVLKLKETAKLPDLSSLSENSESIPKIKARSFSSPSSLRPTQFSAPKKTWGMPVAALGLIVFILAAAWLFTRSSSSPISSLSGQLTQLQTPGQREPLRSFLREHPVPTGNAENDAALEKSALWLEASDYLENLQFLRRQEQVDSLRDTLLRLQNLPKLPELKQSLPQLGYEITEAGTWLAKTPPLQPGPAPVPIPQPTPPVQEPTSKTLAHYFGSKPVVLTTLTTDKNLNLSSIPDVSTWMMNEEKGAGRLIRILPLNQLPLSGEGTLAKPQNGRNRSDPVRFYQGVHLLFESKKSVDLDGVDSFEITFAKDFDAVCPPGDNGRVLQFEDASGLLFSIFILRQGENVFPLVHLPLSMIDLDSNTHIYGLRKELYRDADISLSRGGLAFLTMLKPEKVPSDSVALDGAGSWEKLHISAIPKNGGVTLGLHFPEGEEGQKNFTLLFFDEDSAP